MAQYSSRTAKIFSLLDKDKSEENGKRISIVKTAPISSSDIISEAISGIYEQEIYPLTTQCDENTFFDPSGNCNSIGLEETTVEVNSLHAEQQILPIQEVPFCESEELPMDNNTPMLNCSFENFDISNIDCGSFILDFNTGNLVPEENPIPTSTKEQTNIKILEPMNM